MSKMLCKKVTKKKTDNVEVKWIEELLTDVGFIDNFRY